MHPRARAQRLEVLVGVLGFFTAVSLLLAVVAELHGEPATREVLVLLVFLVPLAAAVWAWRRVSSALEPGEGAVPHLPHRPADED